MLSSHTLYSSCLSMAFPVVFFPTSYILDLMASGSVMRHHSDSSISHNSSRESNSLSFSTDNHSCRFDALLEGKSSSIHCASMCCCCGGDISIEIRCMCTFVFVRAVICIVSKAGSVFSYLLLCCKRLLRLTHRSQGSRSA